MTGLAELQRWMQDAIVAGSDAGARDHVRTGNRLTAEARIGIYASGYRLRLIECLRGEYPLLAALAGPTAFELFALGYIEAHPSRSYTLYDFGADFADWLEARRPPGPATSAQAIPAALARIERAKSEVARAHGVEGVETEDAPFLDTLLGLDTRLWRCPDSVRLLALPFDFTPTLAPRNAGSAPALPLPHPSLLAVARRDYRVDCHTLEPAQHDWLAGLPAEGGPADPRLAAWLPRAIAAGLVTRV
jgi:hypothetical protein